MRSRAIIVSGISLVVVVAILVVSMVLSQPYSKGQVNPSVSVVPANTVVRAGDTFTVDVDIDATGYQLMGCEIKVLFDSNVFSVASPPTGYNLFGSMFQIGPTVETGSVMYAIVDAVPHANVTGTILTIEFEVERTTPTSVHTIQLVPTMADENNQPIVPIIVNNGTVNVTGLPRISFAQVNYNAEEEAGSAAIQVVLSGSNPFGATIQYTTNDGTALNGSDYSISTGTLTFLTGSNTETFNVPIIDDLIEEDDEFLNLALSNPSDTALLVSPGTATLTILANDRPCVMFTQENYFVNETDGSIDIGVVLSKVGTHTVTVDFATSDGSADSINDYTATNGTLTYIPPVTGGTFTVTILDDVEGEGNQTILLNLGTPVFSEICTPGAAIITIIDDEAPTVVTGSASGVSSSCVTLNGELIDLGIANSATVSFEWGENDSYGNTALAGVMTGIGNFSAEVCGLEPDTAYHFRAVADGDGTVYGRDVVFNTLGLSGGGPTVGGTIYSVNKMALMVPWIRFGLSMFL